MISVQAIRVYVIKIHIIHTENDTTIDGEEEESPKKPIQTKVKKKNRSNLRETIMHTHTQTHAGKLFCLERFNFFLLACVTIYLFRTIFNTSNCMEKN